MAEIIDMSSKNENIDLKIIQNKDVKSKKDIEEEEIKPVEGDFDLPISPPQISIEDLITPEEKMKKTENEIEKKKLITLLQNYLRTYPEYLSEYSSMNFNRYSMEELESLHKEFQNSVATTNYTDMVISGYEKCLYLVENVAPYLKMDLKGLSKVAVKQKPIRDCLKQLALEYSYKMDAVKPEYRILMMTGMLCISVNEMNKKTSILTEFLEKPVKENNFDDI